MPGKHSVSRLGLPRYSMVVAAATLLVVLVAWVAVRAVGPGQGDRDLPILVMPPPVSSAPTPVPVKPAAVVASPSPSPSLSPSPSPSVRRTSPRPSRTPSTSPTRRPSPTPEVARITQRPSVFSAGYRSVSSYNRGFVGMAEVRNTGTVAGSWRLTLSFDPRAGVDLVRTWNAQLSRDGNTFVLSGGPLAPGATVTLGFEASKRTPGTARLTGCAVNGTPCR